MNRNRDNLELFSDMEPLDYVLLGILTGFLIATLLVSLILGDAT